MTELVIVSAADDGALVAEMRRVIGFIDRFPGMALKDIAYTCSLVRGEQAIAVIADTTADLRARLASAVARIESGAKRIKDKSGTYWFREPLLGAGGGKLAFVYPGVMGFYPDMMRDLVVAFPECRSAFDELEEALAGQSAFTPSSFIFPPAPYYRHDADVFKSGAYAQALVSTYAACVAMTRLLKVSGVNPDGIVGFAGGDLAAMMRSGAAGAEPTRGDHVKVIADIYNIVHKAVNHGGFPKVAMVVVLLRHPGEVDGLVASFPPDKVMLAVNLSPRQKTFAVTEDFCDEALAAFARAGVRVMRLALDRPFNTVLCQSMVPSIHKFVSGWMKQKSVYDIYSCATAGKVPAGIRAARQDTAERWAKPVLFEETVRRMYADGYRVFLEVGPRGQMSRAVEDTLRTETHAAIATNSIHRSGVLQLQHAVGQLVALGAKVDISREFVRRQARRLDFDSTLPPTVRRDSEMPLSRAFPRLTLLSSDTILLAGASVLSAPTARGARAAARAAAVAQQSRRQRRFDFGTMNPLVSDADIVTSSPGVLEVTKTFKLSEMPFIADFALGTSQLSYADPNLKGLVLLPLPVGAEIMAEVAGQVVPSRQLVTIENLVCRRMISFRKGMMPLSIRAERVAAKDPKTVEIKVLIRGDDDAHGEFTWPVMEATLVFAETMRSKGPVSPEPLMRPRSVHWSGRDIYPARLCFGRRLRGVQFVELWSESGIDYEIQVPQQAGTVSFTRFPSWIVNPLLLQIAVSGFALWRSHEKFVGAFSFPFRMRRLDMSGRMPAEESNLKCYLRLTGVTPKSHICDITVTDGNGQEVMSVSGWEELTERVPVEYRELILQPATAFLTEPFMPGVIGEPSTDVSSAFITEVPYPIFERNEELWLRTLSHVILSAAERKEFHEMNGSTSRRTEWLFGRVAAKEAVRRFLKDYHQARWSDADVQIWADDSGQPHALGAWADYLTDKLDIAIAHTSQFIVALVAANARVGVDVESTERNLSEEFTQGVFTPEELEIAAQAVNASKTIIRFWCAKEAVSKALGTGIRYSPKEMQVREYRADAGLIIMRLEGAWVEAFKNLRGRDIEVTVRPMRDHVVASCFIPASLFDESLVENSPIRNLTEGPSA